MTDHSGIYNALLQQKTSQNAPLTLVKPRASCVLQIPVNEAWETLR